MQEKSTSLLSYTPALLFFDHTGLERPPLFTGDAGSGESEIRRWILENDWLEAIDRLQEYRTALIAAAVTGKIDVREHARG